MRAAQNQLIEGMLELERFTNDGSPTGLTWSHSSSPGTCPRRSARSFALPLLRVAPNECWSQGLPGDFVEKAEVLFPIHPDCVHLLSRSLHQRLLQDRRRPLLVMPTGSPRTVFALEGRWRGFVKLDYPPVLGRFSRALCGQKLRQGLAVSEALLSQEAAKQAVYHFPETGACEISAEPARRAGALFRDAHPTGPEYDELVPVCSLFARDWFDTERKTEPLVKRLAQKRGGVDWISNALILPLVKSFWTLVTRFGLWPEAHAQNIVVGFKSGEVAGIVWRDGQGFWMDPLFWRGAPDPRIRSLPAEAQDATARRSFLFDNIFSQYVLEPLIAGCAGLALGAEQFLVAEVARFSRAVLAERAECAVLPEGTSFCMSREEPRGAWLSLEPGGANRLR